MCVLYVFFYLKPKFFEAVKGFIAPYVGQYIQLEVLVVNVLREVEDVNLDAFFGFVIQRRPIAYVQHAFVPSAIF